MASIENRPRFVVSVKNSAALTKYFPYNKLEAVKAYRAELRAKKYKPKVDQLDEHWLVRIALRLRGWQLASAFAQAAQPRLVPHVCATGLRF